MYSDNDWAEYLEEQQAIEDLHNRVCHGVDSCDCIFCVPQDEEE